MYKALHIIEWEGFLFAQWTIINCDKLKMLERNYVHRILSFAELKVDYGVYFLPRFYSENHVDDQVYNYYGVYFSDVKQEKYQLDEPKRQKCCA